MISAKKWMGLSVCILIILGLTAFLPQRVGNKIRPQPGGFLSIIDGTFVDSETGNTYTISIVAREFDTGVGAGQVTLLINGPWASLCSVHGPNAEIDFSGGGEEFGGNFPVQDIQCGTVYNTTTAIDGCTATTELHGFTHSDPPFIPYLGPGSLDFSFLKSSENTGTVKLKFYTPKGPFKLSGTLNGAITMDTCN
jgi:hypothetical protein